MLGFGRVSAIGVSVIMLSFGRVSVVMLSVGLSVC